MPDSKVYLINNILPNDYTHVVDFPSELNQTSFWITKATSDMQSAGISAMFNYNYTWTPRNNTIQLGINITKLYRINYCMILNTFDNVSKWFYYFITDKIYVNDNVTQCNLQLDVYQTYMFKYRLGRSFIVRQHCELSDDTYDKNLIDEDFNFQVSLSDDDIKQNNTVDYENIIYLITTGQIQDNFEISAKYDPSGTIIPQQGVQLPLYFYYFNTTFAGLDSTGTEVGAGALLKVLSKNIQNLQNTVVGMYYGSSIFFNHPTNYDTKGWGPCSTTLYNSEHRTDNFTLHYVPETVRGYTPKNKKLLHAPFNYLTVLNSKNQSQQYDFAHLNYNNGFNFTIFSTFIYGGLSVIFPTNYYDISNQSLLQTYALDITRSIEVPILLNEYAAYKQTQLWFDIGSTLLNVGSSITQSIAGVSIGQQIGGITGGKKGAEAGRLGAIPNAIGGAFQAANTLLSFANKQAVLSNKGSTVKNYSVPDFGPMAFDIPLIRFYTSSPDIETLQEIDYYFELYGYKTNKLDLPNTTSRPYWNYIEVVNPTIDIQTTSSTVISSIPADSVQELKSIYENGTTIWHGYNNIYNYQNDNHSTTALQERLNNV